MKKRTLVWALALLLVMPGLVLAEQAAGDREFTLSGSGSNNSDFDAGSFGTSFSIGMFPTKALEIALRQIVNYSDFGDSSWSGSTRLALDYHFDLDAFQPFIGANIGGVYGQDFRDTWEAAPEAGLKIYVKDKTFLFGMAEYQFFFRDVDDADDNFDDGQFVYSLGIGFNF
jgi:hypothetical protein